MANPSQKKRPQLCQNFADNSQIRTSPIAANFRPTFFGLDSHFYVSFLLIGHPKISIHTASQRAPLYLNVNYVTVMKYTCTYQTSDKTEIFKCFYSMHIYLDLLLIK